MDDPLWSKRWRGLTLALLLALSPGALAQEQAPESASDRVRGEAPRDTPLGAPYNIGRTQQNNSEVSIRDYLSSRIDQLRSEMVDRFEALERKQQQILDERDNQYAQRFTAQQEALAAALQAQKEAVANALSAQQDAVVKAEDAANKRFDSVNEFRDQLRDQALLFMSKAEADARFKSLEEKTAAASSRLDNINFTNQGSKDLWVILAGVFVLMLAIGGFVMNYTRGRRDMVAK